jgi:SAM-dependent methyltransferase
MVAVPYDPTIYSGSAPHYRPGRPPYSPQLEATLTGALDLDGRGRLLDAGCGPGILALRLAPLFEEVVGLDPDAAMLEEARRFASEDGAGNVRFVQGLAEALPDVAPGPFRLVTFGQSFHWTDEWRVAEAVFDMLEPGGAVAMVAHTVEGRREPPDPGYPRIPHDALRALVAEYLGTRPRSGQGYVQPRDHRFEDVLVRTRFGAPEQLYAPGVPDVLRDAEGVVSGYLSLTTAAPHLFGDRLDEFCERARGLLSRVSPGGLFWDWPGDTAIVLARKPRAASGG